MTRNQKSGTKQDQGLTVHGKAGLVNSCSSTGRSCGDALGGGTKDGEKAKPLFTTPRNGSQGKIRGMHAHSHNYRRSAREVSVSGRITQLEGQRRKNGRKRTQEAGGHDEKVPDNPPDKTLDAERGMAVNQRRAQDRWR